ncbi:hypothetical protein Sjap_026433 [Stephania japonica]|uniref:Heme-binding protein 2-like n=1 Tax=Stephania japonica TaxID=461633 RepID=A0AAP0HIH3_9MAGN
MAANALNLYSFFVFAFLLINGAKTKSTVEIFPPSCNRIECPKFDVIEANNGYEIRSYESPMWMSTAPIDDISFVNATRTGFLQLFDYIQGKNKYHQKIEMTAPVLTQVSPSNGPFCATSFVVCFYIPKENQANPPPAQGLHVQKWGNTLAAVRQFSGFVKDYDIAEETAALYASLEGSKWFEAIRKSPTADPTTSYTVAQYNSPFEFDNRVNEIWLFLDVKDNVSM